VKILFVSHSAGMLGAERSLVEIVSEALSHGRHEVIVAVPRPGPLAATCSALGARIVVHRVYSWLGRWHAVWPVGIWRLLQIAYRRWADDRLLDAVGPEVVVTNTAVVPGVALAARRKGIRHVWIVRESLGTNRQLRSLVGQRVIARTIVRSSTDICVVSRFVHDQLSGLLAREVRAHTLTPRPVMSTAARVAERGGGGEEFRVVMVGYFSREKGQEIAVRAMRDVRRTSQRRVALVLVGRGSPFAQARLRALVRLHRLRDCVRVVGWTDDVGREYRMADASLMLSENEAYGRVTVESLMRGVPVLGVDRGATREILAGGGGELLRSRDARAVADCLVRWASLSAAEWRSVRTGARTAGDRLRSGPSQYQQLEDVLRSRAVHDAAS
jgi:glycosyltransferase involved in cell wall biosynthesis